MYKTNIQFINHASVLISYDNIAILSDPWYYGTAFQDGWRLMHELRDEEIINILKKTTHIYISHEHPDHFRPSFLTKKNIKNILISRKIEFLFQTTKDKRIVNFLKNQRFIVKELDSNKKVKLDDNIEIKIIKSGFYDSLLMIKTPDIKILNLNDCPMKNQGELKKFRKHYGTFDVLLTQFSYAAWKGGRNNKIYRKIAAKEKLETIEKQACILDCKSIIPFASFVYFSNELNFHMNDSFNTPDTVRKFFSEKKINVIVLAPGESQKMNNLKQNQSSLDFWREKYNNIAAQHLKQKDKYNQTVTFEDLKSQFDIYKNIIFKKNSKLLILLLNKIKIMNFFQALKIRLLDHDKIYKYSIFDGLTEVSHREKYDIQMHSQSLSFIFRNEFGFDTLTVNGCFESSLKGFAKSTKTFAIGNLNSIGLNLNFYLIFQPKIIFLFLKVLKNVLNNISKQKVLE